MMKLDRQKQLWLLIGLTALTMSPQYSMQGWQVTGGVLSGMGEWFPKLDSAAWALRAFIEAWTLIYLFSTQHRNRAQQYALVTFEVALIVLIVVTLGPAQAAAGVDQTMREFLTGGWYWAWYYAVASYAPLMLGAAGVAYKIEQQALSEAQAEAEQVKRLEAQRIASEQQAERQRQAAEKRKEAERKAEAERLEAIAGKVECAGCGNLFDTQAAHNAHQRWCSGKTAEPEQVKANGNGNH